MQQLNVINISTKTNQRDQYVISVSEKDEFGKNLNFILGLECKADLSASWKNRCWCRDPEQICHQHQVCFQDDCIYECFGYPKTYEG